jgi:ATP-dependent DNA helicase UvrD/PcrA
MKSPSGDRQHTCSALETWRAAVARELGVPKYTVLTDAALRAIATERPQTREDLARIPGVGPRILAKFGDDVLRQVVEQAAPLADVGASASIVAEGLVR